MTRDEAISLIHMQLGFRSDQTTNIITCLKAAQIRLERGPVKPWFLLSERVTTILSVDEPRLQLPTDFLMEHEENGLSYVPNDTTLDPVILKKDDLDVLKDYYGVDEGAPVNYALDGQYFRIFPIPDAEYTVEMYYYEQDTVLDTNVENEWLKYFPFLLMGEAGLLIAPALRDAAASTQFATWKREAQIDLYRENEARKHVNTSPQIGGSH